MNSSEVFTKADLRNMLLAKAYSLRAAPTRNTPHDAARRQGYMAALTEMAIELGIIEPNAKSLQEG
jgi:hypothetical protein